MTIFAFVKNNSRLILLLISAVIILLIPFIAMQFTDEVSWSGLDFLVMGFLLFGGVLSCELILRKVKNNWYRLGICFAIIALFMIIWAELAVGILGTLLAAT